METLADDALKVDWRPRACRELLALREGAGVWGYRQGSRGSVEPTVLACLGLLASQGTLSRAGGEVRAAADWLVSIQGADGSLGLSRDQPSPRWPTSHGLLLWSVLGGFETLRRRAALWLLQEKGRGISPRSDPDHIVGHDTSLIGWPWVSDTHSWLEPTAMAILALRREGLGSHARVREGLRLIGDRALPDGGWNYGNKAAFGRALRPQPAPTGLALLALGHSGPRSKVVDSGVKYLLETLPQTRAPASLGWGLLGLRLWGETPSDAPLWLAEAYARSTGRPDAATRLAFLLLASGDVASELFGGDHQGDRRG